MQAAVLDAGEALWDPAVQRRKSAWLAGRGANSRAYKPGSQEALLLFCGRDGGGPPLRFPLYARFAGALEPLLAQARSRCLVWPHRQSQGIARLQRSSVRL